MFGFLYNNASLISIVIGAIGGMGFGLILLELRFKRREGVLLQTRRNVTLGIVFICLGFLLFFFMVLVGVNINQTMLYKWVLTLAIGCLFSTVFFTIFLYIMEKRILRRFWRILMAIGSLLPNSPGSRQNTDALLPKQRKRKQTQPKE